MSEETPAVAGFGANLTLKGGDGYEAPTLYIRAENLEDLGSEIQALEQDQDMLKAVAAIAAGFQKAYIEAGGGKAAAKSGGSSSGGGSAKAEPEHGACEKCGNALQYMEGEGKNGRKWKAYGCDGKGYGHTRNFIN